MLTARIIIVVSYFPVISQAFIINQIKFLLDQGCDVRIMVLGGFNRDLIDCHPAIKEYDLFSRILYIYKTPMYKHFFCSATWLAFHAPKLLPKIILKNILQSARDGLKRIVYHIHKDILYARLLNSARHIHVHFGNNAIHVLSKLAYANKNSNLVVSWHGYDAHDYNKTYYTPLFNASQRLKWYTGSIYHTVNSLYTQEKIIRLGCPPNRIAILPVGLDTTYFKRRKPKEQTETYKIIFVGRFIECKAPLFAIQIIEKIQQVRKNVILTLIGDGPEFKRCKNYVVKHNVSSAIHLLGAQSQEIIRNELQKADILLLPGVHDQGGRAESQGLVIQEAQAMELPVIVSDAGGMKYGLIDNETGFVVREKDVDGFVEKLILLMDNRSLREQMGKQGRAFVVKHYDNEVVGQKLLEIYNQPL